ncbi:acireductone dioxygenase [Paenactinomyces guangxiensis]|uniref:Acireductone dioxygenase n=1 Tax=Paenactinomyces guangxiensis TaxID=1490290 RepID=A0A7W2A874_9BACL|nr:cupin domain-containing protein [Paenactinomyces guangxiensis]MBA4494360.1 cupin domain-containing protein [Paenactinomyces guangxiensis]MBH8591585.1 cupin domain-containing protein [Paenactinomyces guangxiensis]
MAQIHIRNSGVRLESEQEVSSFLEEQGVLYEHWPTEKLPDHLREKFVLTDAEKEEILTVYQEEIESLARRKGYVEWDIVALSEATPNLDELLKKFENVHVHTEDEVRAITAGNGIFTIKGNEETGYFDVELTAGDVISVPVNTPHFFTLMENRKVVAVRLFIDPSGWVAHPYHDPQFTA